MNYLDIIITSFLLFGLIKGISNGLIKEITGLLSIIIGIYVAFNFSDLLELQVGNVFDNYEKVKPILIFAILFVSTLLLIKLFSFLIEKFTKALALGFLNRVLGGIFGFLKFAFILSFLIFIESKVDVISHLEKQKTILYNPTASVLKILYPQIEKHTGELKKIKAKADEIKEKLKREEL
tara:strand:+ start:270 stop:809 length:540 start_codon:yes stop_codon:yes gene_type:complete